MVADYGEKLGAQLLNKLDTKPKRQEVNYQAQMAAIDAGAEKLLQDKITKLRKTLRIKDDMINKLLYIDGKRLVTKARYNKCTRDEALSKLTKKQQQLIDKLTIDFN